MTKYKALLIILVLWLVSSQTLHAQVNSVKTTTGYRILPVSILLPSTKITADNLQTSSSGINCATPDISEQEYVSLPWYGNEAYLDSYYDSLQTAMSDPAARVETDIENVWLRIPVQFWVYREGPNDLNPALPDEGDFQLLMDELNNAFRRNGINFRFYMQCVRFVDDASAIVVENYIEEDKLATRNRDNRYLNVHIVGNIPGASGVFNPIYDAVFIRRTAYLQPNTDPNSERVFTHEVGHYFSLLHTHFGYNHYCLQEPVSRGFAPRALCYTQFVPKTSTVTGDLLSDTPADPRLSGKVNTSCGYSLAERDYNNDIYIPDVANYMSYARNECNHRFSDRQKKQMTFNAFNRRYSIFSNFRPTGANNFDRFEPDNAFVASRMIQRNEIQRHSFHVTNCGDNEDWLYFTVPTNQAGGPYTLEIREVAGQGNVVANVETFTGTINNGEINPASRVAVTATNTLVGTTRRVTINTCPGSNYMLRIVRNTRFGEYDVALVANPPLISGIDLACSASSTFSITNPIAGATYLWYTTPGLQITGENNTTSTQIRATGTGEAFVYCDVTLPGCTRTSRLEKRVLVNNAMVTINESPLYSDGLCPGYEVEVWLTVAGGASNYVWSTTGNLQIVTGRNNPRVTISANSTFNSGILSVTFTNACGVQQTLSLPFFRSFACSNFAYTVYPNPADEDVEISPDEGVDNNLAADEPFEVEVYDLMGIQYIKGKTYQKQEKLKLKLKDLPTGSYIMHIIHSQGVVQKHLQIH